MPNYTIRPEELCEFVTFAARTQISQLEYEWRHSTHAASFLDNATKNLILEITMQVESYHSMCKRLAGEVAERDVEYRYGPGVATRQVLPRTNKP